MPIFTNIDEVTQWLKDAVDGIRLDMPGPDGNLSDTLVARIVVGIQDHSENEQRGAEEEWPENSAKYKAWKSRLYNQDKTNYRTTQMLSTESLTGEVTVQDDGRELEMKYGTGEPPSGTSGHIEEADKKVTDVQKAEFAHSQGRSFYDLDDEIIEQQIMPALEDALERYFNEKARE